MSEETAVGWSCVGGIQMTDVSQRSTTCAAMVWSCDTEFWKRTTMHGEIPKVGELYAYEVTKMEEKDGLVTATFQWRKIFGAAP